MTLDGIILSDTARLRLLADMESEGTVVVHALHKREPLTPTQEAEIDRYASVRDHGLQAQVLRLTPALWREMGPARRRLLLDFTVRRVEAMEEKVAFMSRSFCVGELVVPECLLLGEGA